MDPERWQRLSPLLDSLFELPPEARAQRLRQMREEDAALTAELESLIALEEDSADFLSEPLVPPRVGAQPGSNVGPYRLERLLGEGGMGQVWLAARSDGLYQRRVALKLLRPGLTDSNLRLRFSRERQILARLAHPHIARLLDAGITADGVPYLALEYVDGEPITDCCIGLDTPLSQRLRMFQQVCDAVSHAHANLIVHRDLKPSNILVTPAGEVRLLDFGIAKLLDSEVPVIERTRTGVRAFTLHYAAPEQIRGEPVTTMTDVYSLGVVLYELLTDRKPYRLKRDSDAAWEEAILQSDPLKPSQMVLRRLENVTSAPGHDRAPELRRRARMLAGDLDNIVLKALSKRPEQRYPSVEALALDLRRFEDGRPVLARAQSVRYRLCKFMARHRWALTTAGLVTVVLGIAMSLVAWQARQALAEAARAQAMQDFMVGLFEQAGGVPGRPLDLRSLLAAAEMRERNEPSQPPRTRAELLGLLARLRLGLGDYREADSLLQRQAALVDTGNSIPPSLQLESLTLRGQLLGLEAHPGQCLELLEPATSLARGEQARLPSQVSGFYSQLGRCRRAVGEQQGARQMFERSLAVRREPPVDDVGIAENLIDLASLRADAGDRDGALRGLNEAMDHLEKQVGERHPLAIDVLRRRCAVQGENGDLVAAERDCQAALALSTQLHGREHRASIGARRQLATLHVEQGRYAQAQVEFGQVQDWLVARLGPSHGEVARNLISMGIAAREHGQFTAASQAFERAVAIARGNQDAALIAAGLCHQAQLLHDTGRDAQALPLLRQARQLRLARFGLKHAIIGDTDRQIGIVAAAMGDTRVASEAMANAVALTREGYGVDHPRTWLAELTQARVHAHEGDAQALERLSTIAAGRASGGESRQAVWLARAYAGEARCRRDGAQARRELDALMIDIRAAMPTGSALQREVAGIIANCAPDLAAGGDVPGS